MVFDTRARKSEIGELSSQPTLGDYDDDTQRSPSNSRWRPGLTGVSVGVITPRKKSVTTEVACSVGKICTYTLLMTVCSTSNREKTKDEETQAVADTNSLN